jgi:tetratricopeptide (TPR) repeat protein
MKTLKILILTALVSIAGLVNANTVQLDSAASYYNNGEYTKAINAYESIVAEGKEAAGLYFNLANAYYKNNQVAKAILNYERALQLDPKDEDIVFNLRLANTSIMDKMEAMPEFFLKSWMETIRGIISSNAWAFVSLGMFIAVLVLFLVYFMAGSVALKRLGFWLGAVLLIFSIITFNFSRKEKQMAEKTPKAIVITPSVVGKSSPDISGTELFVIHEGLKVTRVDVLGEWCEIRLPDGNKGWVKVSDIELI